MKVLRFLGKVACGIAVCASLASADSLQLRNGRHLQGKYIGGTTTAIGFMTGATVEYFATSEVLALIFDNGNDSPLGGLQPNAMKGKAAVQAPHVARIRTRTPPGVRTKMVSNPRVRTLEMMTENEPVPSASTARRRGDFHKVGCATCTILFRTAYRTRSLTECSSSLRMILER